MLLRLDHQSRVLWRRDLATHHDVSVTEDGSIYVLTNAVRSATAEGQPYRFLDNVIVGLSSDRRVRTRLSVFDAFHSSRFSPQIEGALSRMRAAQHDRLLALRTAEREGTGTAPELASIYRHAIEGETPPEEGLVEALFYNGPEDILHTNSLQVLRSDVPGLGRRGDFLVSVLLLNAVAVIDQDSGRIRWAWGPGAEVGELFLGIAAAAWAINLSL